MARRKKQEKVDKTIQRLIVGVILFCLLAILFRNMDTVTAIVGSLLNRAPEKMVESTMKNVGETARPVQNDQKQGPDNNAKQERRENANKGNVGGNQHQKAPEPQKLPEIVEAIDPDYPASDAYPNDMPDPF